MSNKSNLQEKGLMFLVGQVSLPPKLEILFLLLFPTWGIKPPITIKIRTKCKNYGMFQ